MYPENLCFDKNEYRTFYFERILWFILLINRIKQHKKGERYRLITFPHFVADKLSKSNTFEDDLLLIATINEYNSSVDGVSL